MLITACKTLVHGLIETKQEELTRLAPEIKNLEEKVDKIKNHLFRGYDPLVQIHQKVEYYNDFFTILKDIRDGFYVTIALTTTVALLGVLCGALCSSIVLGAGVAVAGIVAPLIASTLFIGMIYSKIRSDKLNTLAGPSNILEELLKEIKNKSNILDLQNDIFDLVEPNRTTTYMLQPTTREASEIFNDVFKDIGRSLIIEINNKKIYREILFGLVCEKNPGLLNEKENIEFLDGSVDKGTFLFNNSEIATDCIREFMKKNFNSDLSEELLLRRVDFLHQGVYGDVYKKVFEQFKERIGPPFHTNEDQFLKINEDVLQGNHTFSIQSVENETIVVATIKINFTIDFLKMLLTCEFEEVKFLEQNIEEYRKCNDAGVFRNCY